MKRLDVSGPTIAAATRKSRGGVSAWRQKRYPASKPNDHPAQASFLAVYSGQTCLGFLLPRGKLGVEAFDHNDHSLGIFPTQKEAADAIDRAEAGRG